MMGEDEPEGSNMVCKRQCKWQYDSNGGLANSTWLRPNKIPCSEGSMFDHSIMLAHLCKQGGTFQAFGSSTMSVKPKVIFLKVITKKILDIIINWFVCNDEDGFCRNIFGLCQMIKWLIEESS